MKNRDPSHHHFIPQFILRNFLDNDRKLHSYNKIYKKLNKKFNSSKSICSKNHLYTLTHGVDKVYDIEKFYSQIEGSFSVFLREVEAGMMQGVNTRTIGQFQDAEKIVAFFASISFWRLPEALKFARIAKKNLRKIYDSAGSENREIISRSRRFFRNLERNSGNTPLKISQFVAIPALTAVLDPSTSSKIWLHESDFDLVISDNPVICTINNNFQIEGDFYMPIAPRLCLTNRPGLIRKFNNRTFENAKRIVIGCSEDSLHMSQSVSE